MVVTVVNIVAAVIVIHAGAVATSEFVGETFDNDRRRVRRRRREDSRISGVRGRERRCRPGAVYVMVVHKKPQNKKKPR